MGDVFCDYVNVTTPRDNSDSLLGSIRPVLDSAGLYKDAEGLYRLPGGGTVKTSYRGAVFILSASGQVLSRLRAVKLMSAYLWAVAEAGPHRVSLMHATLDIPVDAPPLVARLYGRARQGAVRLSQKAVKPSNVLKLFSPNADGVDTGTVYLGRRTSEVWAKVYDKRQEVLARGGSDIGPMLRVEVAITGKMGITLRDVSEPAAVFYHHASPALVERPADVSAWAPDHDGGFKLPRPQQLLPAQKLRRRVDASKDLTEIVELAEQIGPHGLDYLWRMIEQKYQTVTGAAPNSFTTVLRAGAAETTSKTPLPCRPV